MSFGAGAIRAGLAVVELGVDLDPLMAGLNVAASRLKGWGGNLAKMGAGVAGFGASIAGPILAAFKGAVDQASAMDTLATQLGLTTEKASAFAYAMGTVGISEEEVLGFARHLNSAFAAAADGSHEAVQQFTRLGLNWQELANLPLDERFLAVKEAIGKVNNEFDRSNQAGHFFGARKGMEALKISADEFRKRQAEGGEVGAVVTPEQAAQAKEIQRSFMQIGAAMKFAFVEVGRALLPHHEEIKEYSRTVVNVAKGVRGWVADNKPLVLGVLALGAGITAAGVALVALGAIGAGVAGIISGVGAAAGVIASPVFIGVAGTLAGIAVPLAAAAGAAYLFFTRTDQGAKMLGQYARGFAPLAAEGRKAWGVIKDAAVDSWGGIKSALGRGDLSSAWLVVQAGADVAWEQVKSSFLNVWDGIVTSLKDGWDSAVAHLDGTMSEMLGDLAGLFAGTLAKMLQNLADVANRLGGTTAAKLAGRSGTLKLLGGAAGAGADALGGAGDEAKEWAQKRRQAAEEGLEAAKEARAAASAEARERRDDAVKEKQAALKAILDEEKRSAALAGRKGGGAGDGGGGFGSLQQAAREVRGSFGAGFGGSASARQALGVGSTPVQRQLVDTQKETNVILERIEKKVEVPTW